MSVDFFLCVKAQIKTFKVHRCKYGIHFFVSMFLLLSFLQKCPKYYQLFFLKMLQPSEILFHQFILLNYLWMLLSHFSRVRLYATPQMVAHQAPPSLGFSRQEHLWKLPLKLIFRSGNVSQFSKNSQITHSAGGRYDKKQDDAM